MYLSRANARPTCDMGIFRCLAAYVQVFDDVPPSGLPLASDEHRCVPEDVAGCFYDVPTKLKSQRHLRRTLSTLHNLAFLLQVLSGSIDLRVQSDARAKLSSLAWKLPARTKWVPPVSCARVVWTRTSGPGRRKAVPNFFGQKLRKWSFGTSGSLHV